MSWNHVVLEGHCFYETDKVFKDVPCCDLKPGFTSIVCLSDSNGKQCSYFGYTKARSCIVLTNDEGLDVACDTFYIDEENEKEFIKKENKWISNWKNLIKKSKDVGGEMN